MSYDLMVWKQRADVARVPAEEVCEALCADTAHPATARFDIAAFESEMRAAFEDMDGMYEVADFTGEPANWICFTLPYSRVGEMMPKLHAMAAAHGLTLFDYQDEADE